MRNPVAQDNVIAVEGLGRRYPTMWVSDIAWISGGQTLLLLLGNERRQDDQPFAVSPQLRRAGHEYARDQTPDRQSLW